MNLSTITGRTSGGRRWTYLGATMGAAVSVAANVAHSYVPPERARPDWSPPPGSVIGAVFWPLILFVAIEIFARNPATNRRWLTLKILGLVPVATVAAVVSYRHMSGLLDSFQMEDGFTVAFGPLAVDGLMVMATGMLIMTSPRPTGQRTLAAADAPAPAAEPDPATPAEEPAPTELFGEPAPNTTEPAEQPVIEPARRRTRSRPSGAPARRRSTGSTPDPRRHEAAWRVVKGGESLRMVARDLIVSPSAVKVWADLARAGKLDMIEPPISPPADLHLVDSAVQP